jgi:hypothetical protein
LRSVARNSHSSLKRLLKQASPAAGETAAAVPVAAFSTQCNDPVTPV